ncbi:MAG: zinc ABC transporter solute-binding protein [Gemmatimonadales bacterium]|nr:zinc ABC transporter solute-binding protein [Gemmatimonadales bacterium]NIN50692.1 zinc ABC transporter solute-binding protein [Gemmatimonadales bacterium]NIP08156.1 zinc ABC transporter solute-binding protein [Gemmatimonadales bacterium]NIR01034.1 zinc ABC transporter solute-binding protein [Gemmatimonadales bacterium]NIS65113.1 zinc ABC transporter solute-binding protein [Gemmatimonadales bacterium]
MQMLTPRSTPRHLCTGLRRFATALLGAVILVPGPARAQEKLRVVTTLPTFAAIARELVGELAEVRAIARGDQDPHFVNPRPSFAAMVQRADLFVTTGLDLELWVPAVMDRANNPKVIEGAPGHVVAYSGVKLLQIPPNVSRTEGDIHVFGNPHIHTDPVNGIRLARNIVAGLKRVDPANATTYEANLRDFEERVMHRTFGEQLVQMLGAETLFELAREYRFWDFARGQTYQGKPLAEYLGGWLAEAAPFRNRRMVCYHKNWAYFSARFRIECAMYVEPKPGIPASPGHVREVVDFIRRENIPVLFAANYFSRRQVERVASRTGAAALLVPEHVAGEEGVDDYFTLIDVWVTRLAQAFAPRPGHRE